MVKVEESEYAEGFETDLAKVKEYENEEEFKTALAKGDSEIELTEEEKYLRKYLTDANSIF